MVEKITYFGLIKVNYKGFKKHAAQPQLKVAVVPPPRGRGAGHNKILIFRVRSRKFRKRSAKKKKIGKEYNLVPYPHIKDDYLEAGLHPASSENLVAMFL